jgi:transposase InsO family protein
VLVAMYYFTKWTGAVPLKNMTHKEVIQFITEHIIHRFGIPQTLATDQGTTFVSKEVREFAKLYTINCSIHLHTMLKLMVRLSLVIRL